MSFESLAYRHEFTLVDFPDRWLPLIYLYDPDLPLFPIYYFHVLSDQLPASQRPSETDRAFGYIEKIISLNSNTVKITIVTNKDLNKQNNSHYLALVLSEIRERFGLSDPVIQSDVTNVFLPPLDYANKVISELWERVVNRAYGGTLPFGRLWDEVLGLTSFVASWYSPSGRKSELIQTHYFASRAGERINSAESIPQVDFYLLPTLKELCDTTNPLTIFPNYSKIVDVADRFQKNYCNLRNVKGIKLSEFNNPFKGKFNTEGILKLLTGNKIPHHLRRLAKECFNAFNKGPQRTLIFFMMLSDLRNGRLKPYGLNSSELGSIYDGLESTYQSPKVIHIYAQQSFGNPHAMPIDTWISTFLMWPLRIYPSKGVKKKELYSYIFSKSNNLGKLERLLWISAQARKVHSSACNDAIWCTKLASSKNPRGANPLACNICLSAIRNVCPSYNEIKNSNVIFNTELKDEDGFTIQTSAGNNNTPNQKFLSCKGKSIYIEIIDDFSPDDDPDGFSPFPDPSQSGDTITVSEFVELY